MKPQPQASHTPGPWKTQNVVGARQVVIGDQPINMQNPKDADLIAAAPELLEALIYGINHLEKLIGDGVEVNFITLNMMMKARAKAEGK